MRPRGTVMREFGAFAGAQNSGPSGSKCARLWLQQFWRRHGWRPMSGGPPAPGFGGAAVRQWRRCAACSRPTAGPPIRRGFAGDARFAGMRRRPRRRLGRRLADRDGAGHVPGDDAVHADPARSRHRWPRHRARRIRRRARRLRRHGERPDAWRQWAARPTRRSTASPRSLPRAGTSGPPASAARRYRPAALVRPAGASAPWSAPTIRSSPQTRMGFALAGGGTGFANNFSSGRSDLFQAGAFVRHAAGSAYVATALAYGWQAITNDQAVTPAGADSQHGDQRQRLFRPDRRAAIVLPCLGLASHPMRPRKSPPSACPPSATQPPYAANAFSTAPGGDSFTDSRAELGLRTSTSFALLGSVMNLRGRPARAHDFSAGQSIPAAFQSLPRQRLIVERHDIGVERSADRRCDRAARPERLVGCGEFRQRSVEPGARLHRQGRAALRLVGALSASPAAFRHRPAPRPPGSDCRITS